MDHLLSLVLRNGVNGRFQDPNLTNKERLRLDRSWSPLTFGIQRRAASRDMSLGCLAPPALSSFGRDLGAFLGDRAAARAAPPFNPPRRPRATAAGFLGLTAGGSVLGASPMDSRKTRWASWLGSRGRVFERSGITETSLWLKGFRCQRQQISN